MSFLLEINLAMFETNVVFIMYTILYILFLSQTWVLCKFYIID